MRCSRHRDHEVRSIEVGKRADGVVLSPDPARIDPEALIDVTVGQTLVDGEPGYHPFSPS